MSGISANEATVPRGVYGLRLDGLATEALVSPVPDDWTPVRLERRPASGEMPTTTRVDSHVAELAFVSGWSARVDRRRRTVTFFLPTPVGDDELVHPYLAPPARHLSAWLGREALHGGAFIADGGAWALLGTRLGGKSTTLARLSAQGVPVLSDDVVVVENGTALAGPRSINLRPVASAGARTPLDDASRGRRRLRLPAIAATAPLRGYVVLDWGDVLDMRPLRPAERLVELAGHCRPETGIRPSLLDIARLPAWRLRRPHDPASLDDVCGKLLQAALG